MQTAIDIQIMCLDYNPPHPHPAIGQQDGENERRPPSPVCSKAGESLKANLCLCLCAGCSALPQSNRGAKRGTTERDIVSRFIISEYIYLFTDSSFRLIQYS